MEKDKFLKPANAAETPKKKIVKFDLDIDMDALKERALQAGGTIYSMAADVKDAAMDTKDDITEKINALDNMLKQSVTDYNDAYTQMNDKGIQLYVERCRAGDIIDNVEDLVNSIANHPRSFDTDFQEVEVRRKVFSDSCDFAERQLQDARKAAGGVGAGLAAGASVAFMGPTAAMWIATTFGTASTGTAISTLSGAAATNAALAWLGGGALSAGGGGTAAGSALLALAGPVGWTIAGGALLSSIIILSAKRVKLDKEKNKEIEAVKSNTEKIREMDAQIASILQETTKISSDLRNSYARCLDTFGRDYGSLSAQQKIHLGSLVNNTRALSAMLGKTVE